MLKHDIGTGLDKMEKIDIHLEKNTGYVLITPAKNEEKYIARTLRSVVNQTILPIKWIIVNDGSVDATKEIVLDYSRSHQFIELVNIEHKEKRNFASKVYAIREGLSRLGNVEYQYYGNLDADVSFEPFYYQEILNYFNRMPLLGIAGGKVYDYCDNKYRKQLSSLESVAGPIQMFRKRCFEDIGGFTPLEYGLEDAIAEIHARMLGWQTLTFPELIVLHHRATGSEGRNIWQSAVREGKLDYLLGSHPVYHLARSLQRLFTKPYILGSLLRSAGYCHYLTKNLRRPINGDLLIYRRKEEREKILKFIRGEMQF